jgi:hypothetical protein
MLPAVQIDMTDEGMHLRDQGNFIAGLSDFPCRGMLHEERILVGSTPFRRGRLNLTPGGAFRRLAIRLDDLGLDGGVWNLFERSSKAAGPHVVLALPKS